MIYLTETAEKIAESLLQIKAIKLNPTNPFNWSSGWQSPIYCDNRKTLSYPDVRSYIAQQFAEAIKEKFSNVDLIVGVATGGIALGALVAEALNLPFAYVRSSAKGHGMQNLIEGEVTRGQHVVVIEDLVSTGGSSLKAVTALRENGCNILGMLAIFTYNFGIAEKNFKDHQCKLITLSDYNTMIKVALASDYISEKDITSLTDWRQNPSEWSAMKIDNH